MTPDAPPSAAPTPLTRAIGACLVMMGIGLAGMAHLRPGSVHADLWVGYAVAGIFALGGLALATAPTPTTPPQPPGPLQSALGAGIFTLFAAVFMWWGLFASGGATRVSVGPLAIVTRAPWARALGRVPILLCALMAIAGAVWAWKTALDACERARPGSRVPLAVLLVGALGWGGVRLFRPAVLPRPGTPVVDVPLRGSWAAAGADAPQPHGAAAVGADGASFGGGADWIDYALPAAARLTGSGALELEARAERPRGKRRSAALTLAAAGPYVIDSYAGSDSWRLRADVGNCALNSEELDYGRWTKIALAYDEWAGRAVLYVDGRVAADVACPGPLPQERLSTLRLGTWHEDYQAFTGSLRDVKIAALAAAPR